MEAVSYAKYNPEKEAIYDDTKIAFHDHIMEENLEEMEVNYEIKEVLETNMKTHHDNVVPEIPDRASSHNDENNSNTNYLLKYRARLPVEVKFSLQYYLLNLNIPFEYINPVFSGTVTQSMPIQRKDAIIQSRRNEDKLAKRQQCSNWLVLLLLLITGLVVYRYFLLTSIVSARALT